MKNAATSLKSELEKVRQLTLPSRQEMLARSPSVQSFWNNNQQLLANAWHEWEQSSKGSLLTSGEALLDEKLQSAVDAAWQDPTTENLVKDLWQEAAPGVYTAQFFSPDKLSELRQYLDSVATADIPLRPPYGLVLNRHGAMLDERSEGYLAAPSFQAFYRVLLDKYMRPIARLLFPEIYGYDSQTFGFSIQWQAGMDTSLRLHTDASSVTMNINMNLPDEKVTGSEVDFYDPITGNLKRLSFEPGTAMIHRGNIAHASQPIRSGERSNMVLWLYGDRLQTPLAYNQADSVPARQRWSTPTAPRDRSAPF
ncbi:2OG-Fe(II) oxygenase [Agarivorans aestuarii]|uniref:2OG-Fe(II) oxygenase n=1 Tax=Agarivorans aestuarii TaxID=1563703 RepID=A0ABU7G1W3_9ALTE|nr:2OG-Fe(II) oxygenase [Agarivorans aestuarii]MEE1673343.1 2OG-Fe(II) oxygenase [Agarivorans aestuarii]